MDGGRRIVEADVPFRLFAGDRLRHICDLATGPDDVCFQGKTGSGPRTVKVARLTRPRHSPRFNCARLV